VRFGGDLVVVATPASPGVPQFTEESPKKNSRKVPRTVDRATKSVVESDYDGRRQLVAATSRHPESRRPSAAKPSAEGGEGDGSGDRDEDDEHRAEEPETGSGRRKEELSRKDERGETKVSRPGRHRVGGARTRPPALRLEP
jgi:hypothetical protein